MQQLTPAGQQAVSELAQRYATSVDAVTTLLSAVSAGGGTMAQFYHPELGGGGQWMRGGMTMVGDMFNTGLQARVNGLCSELSALLNSTQVFAPPAPSNDGLGLPNNFSNNWWPSELGSPSSSGGQNNSRYAYFPAARRLATETNGQLAIYDTLDHHIGGVQQQQGGAWGSLSFSSQFGTFTVDSLPRVNTTSSHNQSNQSSHAFASQNSPEVQAPAFQAPQFPAPEQTASSNPSSNDIINAIERLGQLFNQGVLSSEEFQRKKAELLSRL